MNIVANFVKLMRVWASQLFQGTEGVCVALHDLQNIIELHYYGRPRGIDAIPLFIGDDER